MRRRRWIIGLVVCAVGVIALKVRDGGRSQGDLVIDVLRRDGHVKMEPVGPRLIRDAIGPVVHKNWDRVTELSLVGQSVDASTMEEIARLGELRHLNLMRAEFPLDSLEKLKSLDLEDLAIDNTRITDNEMSAVGAIQGLRMLSLSGTQISDDGIRELARLPHLFFLDAIRTSVTGTGFETFPSDAPLERLFIMDAGETDETLEGFLHLRNLQVLLLGENEISDAGLKKLANKLDLQALGVEHTLITDDAAESIGRMQALTNLRLDSNRISDAGVVALVNLERLEKLSLSNTDLSDGAIDSLAQLDSLQKLNLEGTKLTVGGVEALQERLPNCRIYR